MMTRRKLERQESKWRGVSIVNTTARKKRYNPHGVSSLTCSCTYLNVRLIYIDLITILETILSCRRPCEKKQCLCENLMSNNFRKTAVLKKVGIDHFTVVDLVPWS